MNLKCRVMGSILVIMTAIGNSARQSVEPPPPHADDIRRIDSVDRALIGALMGDARMSLTDLAEAINVSRSTAHSRLQRLRDEHVITGFAATVDPVALGFKVAAAVFIDIEQHDWRALRAELAAIPGVEYLAMCAGRFDLMLIARAASIGALRDVLLERIQRLDGVRSTETVIILDELRSPVVA